ncbi:MAG TPA: tripartite tricarboxylate transporter substrate binding protein [Xanthobacteraceae bacterium]|jgi:tripartite-type tricarboxylate transporter receptor subunit TctC
MSGRLLAAILTLLSQITVAFSQQWPARPIHAIVPQSPGSSLDIVPRAVFEQLSAKLGQPIIVENRVGAGNTIAMAAVARADPDGYTILVNSSTHTLVPVTYANLPFDTLRDLVPVIPLGNAPLVLMVSASKGYKSVADFVAAAKAKNGRMNYVSGGAGSSTHFSAEAFRLAAGFQAVHIPQKGAPEALTEVLADRADFYLSPLSPALPFLSEGRLQALAVSGSQRSGLLPQAPTMREAGYPEAEFNFWMALFAPSRTPPEIVGRLREETARALQNPSMQERLARLGVDPLPLDPAAFNKLLQNEVSLNARVANAIGMKVK